MKSFFLRLYERIFKSDFNKNVLKLVGGTSIGQLALLAVSPILTRIYTTSDFGILAIYASIIGIGGIIVCLRYEVAIVIPEEKEEAFILVILSLLFVLLNSIIFGVVFWIFEAQILAFLNAPNFSFYSLLIPLGLLGSGVYTVFSYWAIRTKSYNTISKTKISQGVSSAISQVGLGLPGFGAIGLVIGNIFGTTAGVFALFKNFIKTIPENRSVAMSQIKSMAIRYKKFPMITLPGSFVNNLGVHIPVLLLTNIYGVSVTGLFALADKLIKSPLNLVGKATQNVFIGEFSDLIKKDPNSALNLFRSTSLKLFLVGVLPTIVISIISPIVFEVVFGAEWREAGVYVRILSPMLLFRFVSSPLIHSLNILEKQRVLMVWEVGRLVSILIVFGIGYYYELTARNTLIIYSLTSSFLYFIIFLINYKIIKNIK